jgi:ELWxxDGT repeat protein
VAIIFFDHFDPATGEELWLNSGGITKLVKDINPGPGWSNPEYLTAVGSTLFFTAYDDINGYQLWKTDGTAAGTVMLTSLAPSNSSPLGLLNVNGTLFFEANDGTHGLQLWKSDGTVAGTTMVTNLSQGVINLGQGFNNSPPLIAANGNVFLQRQAGFGSQTEPMPGQRSLPRALSSRPLLAALCILSRQTQETLSSLHLTELPLVQSC